MTRIRLDKVHMFSGLAAYLNYGTPTSYLVVGGGVPIGESLLFTTHIAYQKTKTRADLYAKNLTTGIKMPIGPGSRINPYIFAGNERANLWATYENDIITITLEVFNGVDFPGIILVNQTFEISAVLSEVPISA